MSTAACHLKYPSDVLFSRLLPTFTCLVSASPRPKVYTHHNNIMSLSVTLYDNQFGRDIVLLLPTATTTTTIDAATACFDKKRDRLFINLQFAQLLTICLPDQQKSVQFSTHIGLGTCKRVCRLYRTPPPATLSSSTSSSLE